jgi:hypothetical protein
MARFLYTRPAKVEEKIGITIRQEQTLYLLGVAGNGMLQSVNQQMDHW